MCTRGETEDNKRNESRNNLDSIYIENANRATEMNTIPVSPAATIDYEEEKKAPTP